MGRGTWRGLCLVCFKDLGVRETLRRIRWMFLPIKPLFHSPCQRRRLEFLMILLRRLFGARYCWGDPIDVACLAQESAASLTLWPTCALISIRVEWKSD
ncbi:hypothetical protein AVEN_132733-1 [Araneus ventricosus]|uniref:Uncharacterized protein n=1 Tax=Araneus ventricosus TaxID=182803 RepID=A0A4Y2URA5_ARAVE|nr:hypothetical protein AVEN_132733-1 [Araneus ventricosus]